MAEEKKKTTAEPKPGKHDALVDAWFAEHFHNSKASQDVEIHNILHGAKEALKKKLSEAE